MPRVAALSFTAFSKGSGSRMLTRASFFANSNRTGLAPTRSNCVRSAVSTKTSASLSVLNIGILFFIVLNFFPVHVACAYWTDIVVTSLLAKHEDQKNVASCGAPCNAPKTDFGHGMRFVWQDHDRLLEQGLDFLDGNAVLETLGSVSLIPVESGYRGIQLSIMTFVCTKTGHQNISFSEN